MHYYLKTRRRNFPVAAAALAVLLTPAIRAGVVYTDVTDFTKNGNLFLNLNKEFPNTGASVVNATYLFDPATYSTPDLVGGSDLANNGVTFMLASDSAGNDFEQVNSGGQLTVSSDISGATAVYLLMSAYFGQSFSVTFAGDGGASETFSNVFNPDFCGGSPIDNASAVNGSGTNNLFTQTVLRVTDVGGCGTGNSSTGSQATYDLTEQTFILSSAFAGQNLVSTTISSNGYMTLLLGETVASASAAAPEPATAFLSFGALALALLGRRRLGR